MLAGAVLLSLVGIALAGVALWVRDIANSAPSIDTLKPADSGSISEVFDVEGNSLGFVQAEILRQPVPLEKIPKVMRDATIAIEDANFYEHGGVDYGAVIRAAFENLEAGEVRQGASTITQQLVRNLYIEDPEETLERKIIEAEMAREYEHRFSKDEILETYLNTAPFGTNDSRSAVGVKAAARVYFDKGVSNLELREAALIAGLPQAPTDYNPFLNQEIATGRRNQVLDAMTRHGYITPERAAQAKASNLGLDRGYRYEQRAEQFFFDFVQEELIERYGRKTVRRGGLKVYTTLEPEYQRAAHDAIAAHPVTSAASALVATETETGEILAMASSQTYDTSQFNLAAQGARQPGSAFKPFVLTAAVDQGIDPDSTSYPAPASITLNPDPYTSWPVKGVSGGSSSTLRQATANSINTVFAQLGIDVGPENFAEMAKNLGIASKLDGYYAEALGGTTECCTVLEMANAYATIANGGVHHEPTAIRRVELPNGDVDQPKDPDGERVITDGVAYKVVDIMKGTLDYGTASGFDISCPAAGKTGTTELQSDAWFVGFTPHVATAVWTGNPNERVALPGYGGTLSAPIWREFMLTAASEPCDDFPEPKEPATLSPFSSDFTGNAYEDEGTTTTDEYDYEAEEEDTTTEDFDEGAYAPGLDAPPPGQEEKEEDKPEKE